MSGGGSRGVMGVFNQVSNLDALAHVSDGNERVISPRPNEENPNAANCKPHLKRVCGACPHFSGASLRDQGQRCAHLGLTVNGSSDARSCRFWSRKTAGAV